MNEKGQLDVYVSLPYNIAPIRAPAKLAFSAKYSEYGICGALGLFDHGVREESDMAYACNKWDVSGGQVEGAQGGWDRGKISVFNRGKQ